MRLDIGGYVCIVRDTAGLRSRTDDTIEQEGIRRAFNAYAQAQIKVMVADASSENAKRDTVESLAGLMKEYNDRKNAHLPEDSNDDYEEDKSQYILVINKKDITPIEESDKENLTRSIFSSSQSVPAVSSYAISCTTGEGLPQLEEGILKAIQAYLQSPTSSNASSEQDESLYITRERHRRHVRRCVEHLDRFLYEPLSMDMAAEEIRYFGS